VLCPSPRDELGRGRALVLGEFLEDVAVGVERHGRGVSGLAGDVHHARALVDEQADEAVAQVIGTRVLEPDGVARRPEDPVAPVAHALRVPRPAVSVGEDESGRLLPGRGRAPRREVGGQRSEEAHGADPPALGRLELAVGDGALDEQGALLDVVPAQAERLAGAQAGIGEDGDERGVG